MRREIEPRGIERNTQHAAQRPGQAGFSLVELMVVITIIGILAGIAVPKFQSFRARASQTEAKSGLNALFLSMQAYEANYGEYPPNPTVAYAASLAAIGFSAGGSQPKYSYAYTSSPNGGFAGGAKSVDALVDGRYDTWRINTNKWLCQPYDAVTGQPADTITAGDQTATTGKQCPQRFTTDPTNAATDSIPVLTASDCPLGTTSANAGVTCT